MEGRYGNTILCAETSIVKDWRAVKWKNKVHFEFSNNVQLKQEKLIDASNASIKYIHIQIPGGKLCRLL